MSKQPIIFNLISLFRKIARTFGFKFDHPVEVITGFPPGAFR